MTTKLTLHSRIVLFILIHLFSTFFSLAQPEGGDPQSFLQNEVYQIHVTADPDSIIFMYQTLESEHTFPASVTILSTVDSAIISCGIRLRGNTSLNAEKKSYRISFDSFSANQNWRGLKDVNLIALHNDPSLMRSKLCYDMFLSQGIAAPRTAHAAFYINEQYMGVYQLTEPIDDIFCKTHIDDQGDGNLFKCTYPATLEYLGSNPDLYKFEMWGNRIYELKNNEWMDDYSSIANLIDFYNGSSDFMCYNENPLHLRQYITCAALEILLGHWDNYIFNKNNFYLYYNELTRKFQYLPYDLDNTLGIDWVGQNWTSRNIYQFKPSSESRPLYDAIMMNPSARLVFTQEMHRLCNSIFQADSIAPKITHIQNLIAPFVETDPYYPLDYGFTYNDFLLASSEAYGNHVQFGILDYVTARRNTALQQIESLGTNSVELESLYIIYHGNYSEAFGRKDQNSDSTPLVLEVSFDGNTSMLIDLDYVSTNDFHTTIMHPPNSLTMQYRVLNNSVDISCGYAQSWIAEQPDAIRMNELLCQNITFNHDEFGEYDDWIELFNASAETIALDGYFLTDDSVNWNKFPLPNVSIPGNSFMVFWMDNDPETGVYHGTFSHSQGETISLLKQINNQPVFIESVLLDSCMEDQSHSRNPYDNSWFIANPPTPGAFNHIVTDINADKILNDWVYVDGKIFFREQHDIQLIDMSGRNIKYCKGCSEIPVSDLPVGYYILQSNKTFKTFQFFNH